MSHHYVIRIVGKLFIPFILIFGLYVQFHADFGPGGGFQAGVIFAAGFVLYALIYGVHRARRVVPDRLVETGIALGVLIFAGAGVVSMLLGANYLDYSPFAAEPRYGQHIGIIVVEFGVGLTVATVIMMIFYRFAGRGGDIEVDEDE